MQYSGERPVALASDHAGVALKQTIREFLENRGVPVLDLGPHDTASVDYPDYADTLAAHLADGHAERGVLICGSGIGISIAANRHRHVRCALVHDVTGARLSREHNDANVLALGARATDDETARQCVATFLETPFAGGRHAARVAKLGC